jgi:hypothetical protein
MAPTIFILAGITVHARRPGRVRGDGGRAFGGALAQMITRSIVLTMPKASVRLLYEGGAADRRMEGTPEDGVARAATQVRPPSGRLASAIKIDETTDLVRSGSLIQ